MHITHTYPSSSTLLFHSDIHLSPQSPTLTHQYLTHLQEQAEKVAAIYILGDLFDYWIGPETARHYPDVIACFQAISQTTPIYFMPGNRDFLLSSSELSQWGLTYLPDPSLIKHGETLCLLMHGDLLCTLDISYQRMRKWIRHGVVQYLFLQLPFVLRNAIAKMMRKQSKHLTATKNQASMLACPESLIGWLKKTQCDLLIYGHVHQKQQQVISPPAHKPTTVLTLDSWENQVNYALLSAQDCTIIH